MHTTDPFRIVGSVEAERSVKMAIATGLSDSSSVSLVTRPGGLVACTMYRLPAGASRNFVAAPLSKKAVIASGGGVRSFVATQVKSANEDESLNGRARSVMSYESAAPRSGGFTEVDGGHRSSLDVIGGH